MIFNVLAEKILKNIVSGVTKVGKALKADNADKLIQFGVSGDLFEFALNVQPMEVVTFLTGGNTTNIPNGGVYSQGMIYRRSSDTIDILIFARSTGKVWHNAYKGAEWSDWKSLANDVDLANYFPLDGSKRIEAANASVFKANNKNGANAYIGLYGSGNYIGGIGFTGNADYDLEVLNKNGSGGKKIIHTGNMADHVLPKNGGGTEPTMSTNHPQVLALDNTGDNATTLLVFKHKGTVKGRFGTNWDGKPVYQSAEGTNYNFLYTGNSAAVHIGTTAPSDTSALWVDTSA